MDYRIEQWINGAAGRAPLADTAMIAVAAGAEAAFIALVVVWYLIGWWRRDPADREGAIAALLAAGGALAVNVVLGHVWDRPRPFVAHPATVHLLLAHGTDSSFPSDHAAAGFAIAAVFFAVHRRWGLVALAAAALTAYARVYVGDHYPGDVLAGAAVGVAVALILLGPLGALPRWVRDVADRIVTLLRPERVEAPSGSGSAR
ncbi:MAG: phosphatase PAP2 family protein [Chloroflexota bacterium]|nr:phosphatase PAP2 family protein [Chloroflexota bacterium]